MRGDQLGVFRKEQKARGLEWRERGIPGRGGGGEGRDQARRDLQGALFWQEDPRLSRCEMKDGARPSGCGSVV